MARNIFVNEAMEYVKNCLVEGVEPKLTQDEAAALYNEIIRLEKIIESAIDLDIDQEVHEDGDMLVRVAREEEPFEADEPEEIMVE